MSPKFQSPLKSWQFWFAVIGSALALGKVLHAVEARQDVQDTKMDYMVDKMTDMAHDMSTIRDHILVLYSKRVQPATSEADYDTVQ